MTRLSGLPRFLTKTILMLGSLFMLLVMVAFLATVATTIWLSSTASGQAFLSAQVSSLTADSGYSVDIGPIRARGAGGVMIERIHIRMSDAPVADFSGLMLRPSLAALMAGHAQIDIRLKQLTLHPSPAVTPETAPPPATTTATIIPAASDLNALLASLPFNAMHLDRLRIDQILFVDTNGIATGEPISLDLALAMTRHDGGADLAGVMELDGIAQTPLVVNLRSHAIFVGDVPAVSIDRIAIDVNGIQQTITGKLNLPVTADDARPLPFLLETFFGDMPARLSAMVGQGPAIAIQDIALEGPGIAATGNARQADDGQWHGALKADVSFSDLAKAFPPAADIPLRENLKIDLSVSGETLALTIPRLALPPVDLRDISLRTAPLADGQSGDRSIAISLKETGSSSTLNAKADLRQDETGNWRADAITANLTAGKAGTLQLDGKAAESAMDLTLVSKSLRLDRLRGVMALPDGTPPLQLDNVKIHLQGPASLPAIDWQARLTPLGLPKNAPTLRADAKGRIAEGLATLETDLVSKALRQGRITAQTPLRLSLSPFVFDLPDHGLQAAGRVAGDISALNGFLPVGTRLNGPLDLDVAATGSLSTPVASGTLRWKQGRINDADSGLALRDVDLVARFDQSRVLLESFTARDAKRGRITANGSLGLAAGVWPVDASLKLQDISPFQKTVMAADLPMIEGVFTADLKLGGARDSYLLSGKIGSDRLSIQLPERFSASVPQLNIVEKRSQKSAIPGAEALKLDINLSVPREIFVRGWGLDAEFGGALDIGGTAAEPLVSGMLQSIRGRFEEFGRRFTLSRARLDFRGAVPPSPFLDIVADTRVDGIDASVILTGSASSPEISFSSTPSMPSEDVLSHILFGKDRADITPTQALQLAQTLRRYSGAGGAGLDPLGAIRSGIGLDDLTVDSSSEGGASVGAGKYLADDVYLELNSGTASSAGGAKLKIDLTPNIKAESKIGGDAQAGGGLFWEWEY